jgi:geranylgeranyl reductase family protein
MASEHRYDVVIVGAGPAGSSLAILLRQRGLAVLLLERGRFPRDKICGDFVSPRGLALLEPLGCLDAVLAHGRTRIFSAFVHYEGRKLSGASIPSVSGLPEFGLAVPRMVFDNVLFERARALGVDTVEGARVKGYETHSGGVRVRADVGGAVRSFHGRVLAGADGAESVIARAAGVELPGSGGVLPTLRAYCTGLDFSRGHFFFDEDAFPGFGWIFPISPDSANFGVGAPKELVVRHGLDLHALFSRLKTRLTAEARAVGAAVTFSQERGFPIRAYRGPRRYSFEGGILLGEAARLVDPISGEGIALALESAHIAGSVLGAAFERGELDARALRAYDAAIEARFRLELDVTDWMVSVVRQRALHKLWLWAFRWMSATASRDPNYANQIGGIFAGLIPNFRAFSPEILLKPLLHFPAFFRDELSALGSRPPERWLRLAEELFDFQNDVTRAWEADPEGLAHWVREISAKQSGLMARLGRT